MAYPTHPDVTFDYSSPGQTAKYRVLESNLGSGYRQRAVDGINGTETVWSLALDKNKVSIVDSVVAFLDGRGGLPFRWTPPGEETSSLWICDERDRSELGQNHETLQVKYMAWFGADE